MTELHRKLTIIPGPWAPSFFLRILGGPTSVCQCVYGILVGGFNPHLKNMLVEIGFIFPNFWGENKKTWSERPQERCNVCDLQYQHHQEFWTNCGKTQGFLAYSTCSLDVNLHKNVETCASNGAFSSNSLLLAGYLHLWSTSAIFSVFSAFLVGSVCATCRGWRRHRFCKCRS